LSRAVEELLAGSQQDFPVVENEVPVGILRRNELVAALNDDRRDSFVADVMSHDCESVEMSESLQQAVEAMQKKQCTSMAVVQQARVVGLLTMENISEMIMVNAAIQHQGHRHSSNISG